MKLYHSTLSENVPNILAKGLKPNKSMEGVIYFATSISAAVFFTKARCVDGQNLTVFTINSDDLNDKYLDFGDDHNSEFIKEDVCTYSRTIKPNILMKTNPKKFDFKKGN